MTKTELMETYTAEQLAEMTVKYQNASEVKNDEIQKLKWQISNLEEESGRSQAKLDTYNNYLLPRCTKEAKEMIDQNHFSGVRNVTWEQWNNRGEKTMNIPEIQKCQEEYEKLLKESLPQRTIDGIAKDILKQKNNAMAMEFTRIICDLLKKYGVHVHCIETKYGERITTNSIEEKYGIVFDSVDFSQHDKEFTDKIEELQSEVEKYRKAFEEAKKERDCRITEYRKKIEELYYSLKTLKGNLKVSNMIIEETIKNENGEDSNTVKFSSIKQFAEYIKCFYTVNLDYIQKVLQGNEESQNNFENITDFLPTEPIKVAEMLITAKGECEPLHIGNDVFKDTYRIFNVSELRQIAEHLLVYCNHNGGAEE